MYSAPMIHLQHSGGIRGIHFLPQLPPVHHSPTAHAALLWLGNAARYECDAPFPLANQTALDQRALTFGFIRHLREVLKRNICFRFRPKYLFQAISSAHDRLPGHARWTWVWWHRLRLLRRGSNEGLNELLILMGKERGMNSTHAKFISTGFGKRNADLRINLTRARFVRGFFSLYHTAPFLLLLCSFDFIPASIFAMCRRDSLIM